MILKITAALTVVAGIAVLAKGQLIPGALLLTSAMLFWTADKTK